MTEFISVRQHDIAGTGLNQRDMLDAALFILRDYETTD